MPTARQSGACLLRILQGVEVMGRATRRCWPVGCLVLLAACTAGPAGAPVTATQPGQLRVFFEPADAQGLCALTFELRNLSTGWRGEAVLEVALFDERAGVLQESRLVMDPLLPDRISAKNLPVPARCREIARLEVRRATWHPYPSRVVEDPTVYRIAGVEDVTWRPRWDEALGLLVGDPVTP